ncbi:hypothetical protein L7F22_016998 [Adiantum nelumboides]|nr:hypothetical protein [Adiantum nelumboides]
MAWPGGRRGSPSGSATASSPSLSFSPVVQAPCTTLGSRSCLAPRLASLAPSGPSSSCGHGDTLDSIPELLGRQCITLVLRSIWPSYNNLPNSIPESAGVTTREFLSFFLFWLCMLPAAYTRVEKIKYLFIVKSIVVPAAFFAMFGWSIHDANGLGPIVHQPSRLQGSALGWAFVTAVTNQISNMVTLVCNMADFARVARKRSDTVLSQALAIPLTFAITSFVGLIIASSSTVIFGTTVFNILDILSMRLDRDPQASGVRAGTFFIAASFTLGQIGTNVAANTLSAGSDLTALFPRYLTIRRGSMLSLAIALCICPWKFATPTPTLPPTFRRTACSSRPLWASFWVTISSSAEACSTSPNCTRSPLCSLLVQGGAQPTRLRCLPGRYSHQHCRLCWCSRRQRQRGGNPCLTDWRPLPARSLPSSSTWLVATSSRRLGMWTCG